MSKKIDKTAGKRIALTWINELFLQANKIFSDKKFGKTYSSRYVELARNISTRCKIRIPSEIKRQFCKKCSSYLMPGQNCRVRTKNGHMVYFCQTCKTISRFPYIREQKEKRKQKSK